MQNTSNVHGSLGPLMGQNIKVSRGVNIVDQNSAAQDYWGVRTFPVHSADAPDFILPWTMAFPHLHCVSDPNISSRDGCCLAY